MTQLNHFTTFSMIPGKNLIKHNVTLYLMWKAGKRKKINALLLRRLPNSSFFFCKKEQTTSFRLFSFL